MQWLLNEFKRFREHVDKRVDEMLDAWAKGQIKDAEEIEKLKGEIKAMKARAGKQQKEQAHSDGIGTS